METLSKVTILSVSRPQDGGSQRTNVRLRGQRWGLMLKKTQRLRSSAAT
jgi:hypothetical protein